MVKRHVLLSLKFFLNFFTETPNHDWCSVKSCKSKCHYNFSCSRAAMIMSTFSKGDELWTVGLPKPFLMSRRVYVYAEPIMSLFEHLCSETVKHRR